MNPDWAVGHAKRLDPRFIPKRSPTCNTLIVGAIPCGSKKSNARMAGQPGSRWRYATIRHPDFPPAFPNCAGQEALRQQYAVGGKGRSLLTHRMPARAGICNGDIVRNSMHAGRYWRGGSFRSLCAGRGASFMKDCRYDHSKAATSTRYVSAAANVLTLDIGTSQLAQAIARATTLVEVKNIPALWITSRRLTVGRGRYFGEYVPASQGSVKRRLLGNSTPAALIHGWRYSFPGSG